MHEMRCLICEEYAAWDYECRMWVSCSPRTVHFVRSNTDCVIRKHKKRKHTKKWEQKNMSHMGFWVSTYVSCVFVV